MKPLKTATRLFEITLIGLCVASSALCSEEVSLSDQLDSLELPENRAPGGQSSEMLYATQDRYSPLRFRSEIAVGGGKNFTGDSFLTSNELNLGYRLHFNSKWSLGASGAYVFNEMTGAAERIVRDDRRLPDSAYTKTKADLTVGYNLFYGKFRLSLDQVFYFDHYLQLGPGYITQNTGQGMAAVIETGLVFWLGRWGSARVGLRDYYHNEKTLSESRGVHDLIGSLQIGFLLGSGI